MLLLHSGAPVATTSGPHLDGDRGRTMIFDHVGLIATEVKPGEVWVEATKVWVTDPGNHPYRVEWLRYAPDSPVQGPVRGQPHVAYRVDDLEAASSGLTVLLPAFDVWGRIRVAFFQTADGAVVELMQDIAPEAAR